MTVDTQIIEKEINYANEQKYTSWEISKGVK